MKISIITPCLNAEEFIAKTIESIISQAGNFEIEYIIMDGKSIDKTLDIVKSYKEKIDLNQYGIQCDGVKIHVYSEEDQGMYTALNKGFKKATGDILAYLNSDDIYLPGCLANILSIFQKYPEILWLKGISSTIDCHDQLIRSSEFQMYIQKWINEGKYGKEWYFITQESVFWRPLLWKMSGGFNEQLKFAGDYQLWIKFSEYSPLYLTNIYTSCFRKRKGQLSQDRNYSLEMTFISGRTNYLFKIFRKLIQNSPSYIKTIFANIIYKNQLFYIVIFHKNRNLLKTIYTSRELNETKLFPVYF